jgi:hydrogenase-1 operon protein HyaF
MRDFNFLADDTLVDALLVEISGLMENLAAHNISGSIDLLGLPLSAACLALLEQRLGTGEISATLTAAGSSEIRETSFAGVWWSSHADETGRIVAMLIDVALVPELLKADIDDVRLSHRRLLEATGSTLSHVSA